MFTPVTLNLSNIILRFSVDLSIQKTWSSRHWNWRYIILLKPRLRLQTCPFFSSVTLITRDGPFRPWPPLLLCPFWTISYSLNVTFPSYSSTSGPPVVPFPKVYLLVVLVPVPPWFVGHKSWRPQRSGPSWLRNTEHVFPYENQERVPNKNVSVLSWDTGGLSIVERMFDDRVREEN